MKCGGHRLGIWAGLLAIGFGLGVLAGRGLAPGGMSAPARADAFRKLSRSPPAASRRGAAPAVSGLFAGPVTPDALDAAISSAWAAGSGAAGAEVLRQLAEAINLADIPGCARPCGVSRLKARGAFIYPPILAHLSRNAMPGSTWVRRQTWAADLRFATGERRDPAFRSTGVHPVICLGPAGQRPDELERAGAHSRVGRHGGPLNQVGRGEQTIIAINRRTKKVVFILPTKATIPFYVNRKRGTLPVPPPGFAWPRRPLLPRPGRCPHARLHGSPRDKSPPPIHQSHNPFTRPHTPRLFADSSLPRIPCIPWSPWRFCAGQRVNGGMSAR